jgi:RNA polymerase sigma-70 factor, ECF subfamily
MDLFEEHVTAHLADHIVHLKRYAMSLTRNSVAADDLVQDTLCRALSRRHLLVEAEKPAHARAWLCTILYRRHIQAARYEGRHPTAALTEEVTTYLEASEKSDSRLLLRDADKAIAALEPASREVLLRVGLLGESVETVAQILKVPTGTVMSRLFRARAEVRWFLENGTFLVKYRRSPDHSRRPLS